MFFRVKKSGARQYLQIVENRWEEGQSRQRVLATLGRLEALQEDGALDSLLRSGSRFSDSMMVISRHQRGESMEVGSRRIGPARVFERLWQEVGCQEVTLASFCGCFPLVRRHSVFPLSPGLGCGEHRFLHSLRANEHQIFAGQ
jgi:hypothetical protein